MPVIQLGRCCIPAGSQAGSRFSSRRPRQRARGVFNKGAQEVYQGHLLGGRAPDGEQFRRADQDAHALRAGDRHIKTIALEEKLEVARQRSRRSRLPSSTARLPPLALGTCRRCRRESRQARCLEGLANALALIVVWRNDDQIARFDRARRRARRSSPFRAAGREPRSQTARASSSDPRVLPSCATRKKAQAAACEAGSIDARYARKRARRAGGLRRSRVR